MKCNLLAAVVCLLFLGACGCAPEKGDSTSIGDYWDGCWTAVKENRREPYIFPDAGG